MAQSTRSSALQVAAKNQPRVMNGWAMYDWANSSYALVINTALFPIYFQAVMAADSGVSFLGWTIAANAAYSFSLTLSFLLLLLLSPVLSSIAASRGNKWAFLRFFCGMGALATMGLFFFSSPDSVGWALGCNVVASIGFYGSLVFYNAYLPEIASKDRQDALSARGFALGYLGSLLMLLLSLVLVQGVATDENRGDYTRLCFLLTGLWWWGFAQFSLSRLPRQPAVAVADGANRLTLSVVTWVTMGFAQLRQSVHTLVSQPRIKWFLTAFVLYSVGMQTIFLIATFIGNEIGLSSAKMIATIMALQLEAIVGALGFAWIIKRVGNTPVLMLAVLVWVLICGLIYRLALLGGTDYGHLERDFFITAGLVGMVMGGLQAASRSTYSKLLPQDTDASPFFSVYDVLEKVAIVLGTAVHGYLLNQTGSTRASAVALGCFFMAGLWALARLRGVESLDTPPS